MRDAATHDELRDTFEKHYKQTTDHVRRLEDCFRHLGITPQAKTCEAMRGLIRGGEQILHARGWGVIHDVALIGAAQRVEHYEIAAYGTLITVAKHLEGADAVVDTLKKTIDEEKATDCLLTKIAEGGWFSSGSNDAAEYLGKSARGTGAAARRP